MGPPSTPDLLLIIVCQAYEFPDPSGPGISKISDSGPERNACESSLIVFIPHLECEKTGLKSYKSETQVGCWYPQQPSCLFSPTHCSSLRSSQFPLLTLFTDSVCLRTQISNITRRIAIRTSAWSLVMPAVYTGTELITEPYSMRTWLLGGGV